MISPDMCHDSIEGETKRLRSAISAPARPVIIAEATKPVSLTLNGSMPTADSLASFWRAASSLAPKREPPRTTCAPF